MESRWEIQRHIKKKIKTTRCSATVNVLAYFLTKVFPVCMYFHSFTELDTGLIYPFSTLYVISFNFETLVLIKIIFMKMIVIDPFSPYYLLLLLLLLSRFSRVRLCETP